ncbi:hypothetical protein SGRIM128S_00014 [Streptomyces griseomycini]
MAGEQQADDYAEQAQGVQRILVVEDHAGGDGGQQPAHLRVEPGLVVEVGVLLVVRHLAARGVAQVAAGGEPGAGGVGGLVGVHLVAQEEQDVGPLAVRVGGDASGQGVQGVGADRVVLAGGRGGPAAGAEGDAHAVVVGARGGDGGGRQGRGGVLGRRPHPGAVQEHLVRRGRARGQTGHPDERVVVPGDLEGAGRPAGPVRAAHLGGARAARLDPDGRGRAVDVPQQWSEPQSGHGDPFLRRFVRYAATEAGGEIPGPSGSRGGSEVRRTAQRSAGRLSSSRGGSAGRTSRRGRPTGRSSTSPGPRHGRRCSGRRCARASRWPGPGRPWPG